MRTTCAACGKSIPTHVDSFEGLRETWPLVVSDVAGEKVVALCSVCHDAGKRPGSTDPAA